MSLNKALGQLCYAKEMSFREFIKSWAGRDPIPYTLDEKAIAAISVASKERIPDAGMITAKLPDGCKDHFEKLQKMDTSDGPFFERFVLFAKSDDDGMLVGFGTDEMYYVVIAFDQNGQDIWIPTKDLYDNPVLA